MENTKTTPITNQNEVICKNCSARLTYAPGTNRLKCEHCGTVNDIKISAEVIEELDFEKFINDFHDEAIHHDVITVKCEACSAQTSFEPDIVSGVCPFCGNPIVITDGTVLRSIQPNALLPFTIDKKKAVEMYSQWLKQLWWAPDDLLKLSAQEGKLTGMYIPYWTYDTNTTTSYTGERGEDITETEEYEETNDDGETVINTRTITRTIWYPVSGNVTTVFDNTLVIASRSLPRQNTEKLEPWDLQNLVPFESGFLSGYKTESYQIDLKEGFEEAKSKMEIAIRENVLSDIGGFHQRILFMNNSYNNITFKHILLPLWISSYRYQNKAYRFMINGRSGHVQGERPYSWGKIALAISAGIIVIIILMFLI
jgi:LSD1 subclass zinc finger protein